MTHAIKIAILGPCFVGKTSIVQRLRGYDFRNVTETTIGMCFSEITWGNIIFNLWDTAGEERYLSVAPIYYRGAHILIFVFDVTVPDSLAEMTKSIDEAMKVCRGRIHFIIVGNKIDRLHPNHRTILEQFRNNTIIREYGLESLEIIFTSAQTSAGLDILKNKMLELAQIDITTMDVGKIVVTDTPVQSSSCVC